MTRLVFLPGLGADHRLFSAQKPAFPDLIVPPWPVSERGTPGLRARESLPAFASRVASSLLSPKGDLADVVLAGVSFGGMVAAEIASQLAGKQRPRGLILISTCLSPAEIAREAHRTYRFARWVPLPILERTRPPMSVMIRSLGPMSAEVRSHILEMEHAVPIGFISRAAGAIFSWPGADRARISCPVLRIHGTLDRIILPPTHDAATTWIQGAGHVACLTHPSLVNEAIARFLAELDLPGCDPSPGR